jgi:APA family basic amino acid/polyamine antiporter
VEESTQPSTIQNDRGHLLKLLGVAFGLAVIIGGTIGGGILRTPGDIATLLPTPALFLGVWVVGGLYALLGAISLAELGTMIPRSGGQYVFARRGLGEYAGFVVGWSDWLSTCGTTAAISIIVGQYLTVLIPPLTGHWKAIALSVAMLFALLQWKGVVWGSRTQNVTSIAKGLLFILFVVAAFALTGGNQQGLGKTGAAVVLGAPLGVAFIKALQSVIYTYDGWNGVIYFSEEVRDVRRDITRSMFAGVALIIAIYLLVNFALLWVMPLSQFAGSDLAVGTVANVIFGANGDTVIRILMVVSLLSTINACHLMSSRVLFAMSKDGLFLRAGASVNKGGTPWFALFVSALAAVAFILTGTFERVLSLLAFFFVANYTVSFITVFVLRRREPDAPRPYRAWGYPFTTGLSLIGSLAFLIGAIVADRENSVYALLLLLVSYPVFLLVRWTRRRELR